MTAPTWDALDEALAAELPLAISGDTVVLQTGHYYVQFTQMDDELLAEAVGNAYLPPEAALSAETEQRLLDLGWRPPEPPDRPANWWDTLPWPATTAAGAALATRMVHTLRDVFGIRHPDDLRCRAWRHDTNEPLDWPVIRDLHST